MKTYKLKGLEFYIAAHDIDDVIEICWINGIGITENNVEETGIPVNVDALGTVCRSLEEYQTHSIILE